MMSKFVIKLTLFFLPFVLMAYPIDVFLSKHLRKNSNYVTAEFETWNALYDGQVNSNIVIYGSSRAMNDFDSKMMKDSLHTTVYNLGVNGHRFEIEYLRHQALLNYNKHPKVIIYSLDFFMLERQYDLFYSDQFLPYMLFNKDMKDATIERNVYNIYDYNIPLIRYYGKKEAIVNALKMLRSPKVITPLRQLGYMPKLINWNEDFNNAKKLIGIYKLMIDRTLANKFDDFLTSCEKRDIEVVLVYSPEYIEGQKFVENREAVIDFYKMESKKHHLHFYDWSNNFLTKEKKYFSNSEHLNKQGAEIFSNQLID